LKNLRAPRSPPERLKDKLGSSGLRVFLLHNLPFWCSEGKENTIDQGRVRKHPSLLSAAILIYWPCCCVFVLENVSRLPWGENECTSVTKWL
jgi:hypothetical protein